MLVVIAWGPTPATQKVLPVLFMIGLLIVGMEVLRRQTAREHPNASREESMLRLRAWFSGLRGRGRAPVGGDPIEQLERLGRLREQGLLEPAEFERQKERILA